MLLLPVRPTASHERLEQHRRCEQLERHERQPEHRRRSDHNDRDQRNAAASERFRLPSHVLLGRAVAFQRRGERRRAGRQPVLGDQAGQQSAELEEEAPTSACDPAQRQPAGTHTQSGIKM